MVQLEAGLSLERQGEAGGVQVLLLVETEVLLQRGHCVGTGLLGVADSHDYSQQGREESRAI